MKKKFMLGLTVLSLVLAALACKPPWGPDPEPEPEQLEPTPTFTQEEPEEEETEEPTEEPTPDLIVFTNPVIFDFSFFTTTEGWAVTRYGDHLLITVDGGDTWLNATPAGLSSPNLNPFFLDETTAWFVFNNAGSGVLYHTQDSGVNWTMTSVPFDGARLFFLDLNSGFALVSLGAGAGSHYYAIYQTADGGVTWTEVFAHEPGEMKSLPEGGSKNGITFIDLNNGWIGGAQPMTDFFYLYYTEDGGATWVQELGLSVPPTYAGSMLDVEQPVFVDASTGFLPVRAMNPPLNPYMFYRSEDYGVTWTYKGAIMNGKAVDFISINEVWAAGPNELFHSMDGGETWTAELASGIPAGEFFMKLDFVGSQHGWALTTPDESTWEPLKLFRTTDYGVNWTQLLP